MGKLIVLINTTTDGFCDSELVTADQEFHEFVQGLLASTQTVAYGRKTFEFFQEVWPKVLDNPKSTVPQVEMAQALNDIDKIVFSTSLENTKWNNSSIVKKIDPVEINNFKQSSDKNWLTIGSPGLVAGLTKSGLVDEYYFSLQPTIAGKGKVRLFDKINLETRQPLKFKATKQLNSGVVIVNYLAL